MQSQSQPTEATHVQQNPLPKHVAIIMDGNGRWAKKHSLPRLWGHKKGADRVKEIVRVACKAGVKVLTLYAFSDENWGRPKDEVEGIFALVDQFLSKDRETLRQNGVQLRVMGQLSRLPVATQNIITETVTLLNNNTKMILNIALSYGSKNEICEAVRLIAEKVKNNQLSTQDISPELIDQNLYTHRLPAPDLLIRTSGEQRLSNFLLWQLAYSELWFTTVPWPDFCEGDFLTALQDFQKRQRRFGLLQPLPSSPSASPI